MTEAQVTKRLNKIDKNLGDAVSELESLKDDMQEEFDEKSEKWQEGEKGVAWDEKMSNLEDAINSAQEAQTTVQSCM